MKAFAFSLIALILLCVIVFLNTMFISNVSEEMQQLANKIKSSPNIDMIKELEDIWNDNRLMISISVPHKETDELEKNLILLRANFENGDTMGISEINSLLIRSIDELEIHGTVSFDNVF